RRRAGLTGTPQGGPLVTIAVTVIGGAVLGALCNANKPAGVAWNGPFVLVVLAVFTFVLNRTKLGRYIYAIGGNPEAARRAGINVPWVRTFGFMLCSFTAIIAGIIYASRLG